MIKCGSSGSSVDIIEDNAKRSKKNQINTEDGAANSETKDIFTISSSEIQTSSAINDSSITDDPSPSKGLFDRSNLRPTCHRDIELQLLDIEDRNEIKSFETLSVRQVDDMLNCLNNESEYISAFKTLLRHVDCNKNGKISLKIDMEQDLLSGCMLHKESIKGKSKNNRKRQTISKNQYSIEKPKRPITIFLDETKRIIRTEKRREIIRKLLQFAEDNDRFDYYLNLLIDLEESFVDERL